jgi:hypothetical protein
MKVDFSTVHPCRIGWPERVRIKDSPAARRAYATRPFTLLRWFAGIAVGRLLSDTQVDAGFDVSAIGAESFRPYLGELTANPADLLRLLRASVEEPQSCIQHQGPSSVKV